MHNIISKQSTVIQTWSIVFERGGGSLIRQILTSKKKYKKKIRYLKECDIQKDEMWNKILRNRL